MDEDQVQMKTKDKLKISGKSIFDIISTHETRDAAIAAVQSLDGHIYKYRYNNGTTTMGCTVYQCVSHVKCEKRARIRSILNDAEGKHIYRVEATRKHSYHLPNVAANISVIGIRAAVKNECDTILSSGYGARQALILLKEKYQENKEMLDVLPNEVQLKNRKAYLKRNEKLLVTTKVSKAILKAKRLNNLELLAMQTVTEENKNTSKDKYQCNTSKKKQKRYDKKIIEKKKMTQEQEKQDLVVSKREAFDLYIKFADRIRSLRQQVANIDSLEENRAEIQQEITLLLTKKKALEEFL